MSKPVGKDFNFTIGKEVITLHEPDGKLDLQDLQALGDVELNVIPEVIEKCVTAESPVTEKIETHCRNITTGHYLIVDNKIISKDIKVEIELYHCLLIERECPYGISGGIGTRCYKTIEHNSWYYCPSGWK